MEYNFTFNKSFRFEVINSENNPTKVLFVLHGYGQLVKYFIRKFSPVPSNYLIVAPEGMHRFYLNGTSGRVGASWMTKEAREQDIADTINYLNEVNQIISKQFPIETRHLLGFSQGGATAARWEQIGNVNFNSLILWGCVFPPDLDPQKNHHHTKNKYFVIGDEDEYFRGSAQKNIISTYTDMKFNIVRYKGKHDIDSQTLKSILHQIEYN